MTSEFPEMTETFYVGSESCVFTFDGKALRWRDKTVRVPHMINIDYVHSGNCCGKGKKKGNKMKEKRGHDSVIVYYAQTYKSNKLRKASIKFQGDGDKLCLWRNTLKDCLDCVSCGRPKQCLVFINPFSGRQTGVELFMTKVKPLFEIAEIETCVTITRNRYDFEKVICSGIDCYDSILAIGGDGTVSEIVNSLISSLIDMPSRCNEECDSKVPKIKIPIAIIPCGSMDCVAYTLNGTRDPETNALHAILGNRCCFDVCRAISQSGVQRFFIGAFSYGFLSDLIQESDKFNWMGPMKYNYAGLLTLVRSKECYGKVVIVGERCCMNPPEIPGKPKVKRIKEKTISPPSSETDGEKPSECGGDQQLILKGRYFLIACANISCSSELAPNGIAPQSSIGDGYMYLILFQPNTLCDLYKMYSRLTSRDKDKLLSDLPFVTMYRTKKLKISVVQNVQKENCGNCDGELFHDSKVTLEVYQGIVEFFARKSR